MYKKTNIQYIIKEISKNIDMQKWKNAYNLLIAGVAVIMLIPYDIMTVTFIVWIA